MDPETPLEPPPPAYEAEQEFDRKISDALQRTLVLSQQPPSSHPTGEWEVWDEAQFEAAAARAREQSNVTAHTRPPNPHSSEKERLARQHACQSRGASSSTSPELSLNSTSVGRRLPASPPVKERPSWYVEAQLGTPAGSGPSQSHQPSSAPPQVHRLPPEEEEPSEPLPPFVAVGPSLEGPPFEEVVRQPLRIPLGSDADSPPQSPLDGEDDLDAPSELPQRSSGRSYFDDRHRSTSPRQSHVPPSLRPLSSQSPPPRPPSMAFDSSVAYPRQRTYSTFATEAESKEPVDASAFYPSAVSSYLATQTPKKKIILNRELPVSTTGMHRPNIRDRQTLVSPGPYAPGPSFPQHGSPPPPPTSYYPVHSATGSPNQQVPYGQPRPQQPQQVAPAVYSPPFQGVPPRPPLSAPPHWPPPNSNVYGRYGR